MIPPSSQSSAKQAQLAAFGQRVVDQIRKTNHLFPPTRRSRSILSHYLTHVTSQARTPVTQVEEIFSAAVIECEQNLTSLDLTGKEVGIIQQIMHSTEFKSFLADMVTLNSTNEDWTDWLLGVWNENDLIAEGKLRRIEEDDNYACIYALQEKLSPIWGGSFMTNFIGGSDYAGRSVYSHASGDSLVDQLISISATDNDQPIDHPSLSLYVAARLPPNSHPLHLALLEALFIAIAQSLGGAGRHLIDVARDYPSEVKVGDLIPANVDPGFRRIIDIDRKLLEDVESMGSVH